MSVSGSDVLEYTSASAGSTGGAITGSTITSGVANNVNPDITDSERIAGVIKYRKTFWKNNHGTDDLVLPVIYVPVAPTNAALVIGFGINNSNDADSAQGNMSAWSAAAKVALISDGTDTRVCTIVGMNNAGTPVPTIETVTLTNAAEVLSVATFSEVFGIYIASTSGTRAVTIKQGTGGTVRGTIPVNKINCWLWITAATKGAGLRLPNLPAAQSYGVWRRLTVSAGAGPVRPDSQTVRIEENN